MLSFFPFVYPVISHHFKWNNNTILRTLQEKTFIKSPSYLLFFVFHDLSRNSFLIYINYCNQHEYLSSFIIRFDARNNWNERQQWTRTTKQEMFLLCSLKSAYPASDQIRFCLYFFPSLTVVVSVQTKKQHSK